jgi:hypothetical protein
MLVVEHPHQLLGQVHHVAHPALIVGRSTAPAGDS